MQINLVKMHLDALFLFFCGDVDKVLFCKLLVSRCFSRVSCVDQLCFSQ